MVWGVSWFSHNVVTSYHSTPSPSGQDDILPLAQSNLLLVVHAIQLFTCLTLDTEEKKSLESRLNPISVQYALSNVLLLHKDGSTSTQPPESIRRPCWLHLISLFLEFYGCFFQMLLSLISTWLLCDQNITKESCRIWKNLSKNIWKYKQVR